MVFVIAAVTAGNYVWADLDTPACSLHVGVVAGNVFSRACGWLLAVRLPKYWPTIRGIVGGQWVDGVCGVFLACCCDLNSTRLFLLFFFGVSIIVVDEQTYSFASVWKRRAVLPHALEEGVCLIV